MIATFRAIVKGNAVPVALSIELELVAGRAVVSQVA